jgi:hypothetical protein
MLHQLETVLTACLAEHEELRKNGILVSLDRENKKFKWNFGEEIPWKAVVCETEMVMKG